ncbi:MAG: lipoate--protein ligase family protein [Gemmataceae bacterium]
MPAIRLLPFESADGPTNMAADEAMLESAELGVASLRFYAWSEPTITLGYFQPAAVALSGLPWVRRSTGGDAIVHHRELTYGLALPNGREWRPAGEPWTCRFHHLLRDVLGEVGIESRAVLCGEEQRLGETLCFLHQTAGDLLIRGSKVAGSAQRKRHGALLQHGSILLERSEHASMLPGINDLTGASITPRSLAERLAAKFEARPGDWTDAERERTAAIRAEKYANPDWNFKR